jgi:hypothetical protein
VDLFLHDMSRRACPRARLGGAGIPGMIERMRRLATIAALAGAVLSPGTAEANGRFPATVNIRFHPTDPDFFIVPVTFGLLITKDGGASFQWVCELAIGYTGTYDPDYIIADNGEIFATSFDGLKVSTDQGCTWELIGSPLDSDEFISQLELGPDGRIWAPTATGGDNNMVYVSDDRRHFRGVLGQSDYTPTPKVIDKTWWLSVATTKADVNRVYVSAYVPDSPARAVLKRKTTADDSLWEDLPVTDIDFGEATPFFYLVGASPTDANVVFGRAVAAVPPLGDALYRSEDGGQSWTKVLEFQQTMDAFEIRSDGSTVIAGSTRPCAGEEASTDKGCVQISTEGGAAGTWHAAEAQPQMWCVGERSDGKLLACGYNYAPDNFAIGSSDDGETWDPVFRFAAFEDNPSENGPLMCPSDTVQAQTCATEQWSLLACFGLQLDLPFCDYATDAGPAANDGGPDGGGDGGGCCRASGAAANGRALPALFLVVGLLWMRRRKR